MSINLEAGVVLGGGRYTVVDRLGRGNMGEVFVARDDHLGAEVVLKFPARPDGVPEDAKFLERFERETRSLIRLSHPHVVKVVDVGRHDGRPFVVMQYLRGGSLYDRAGVLPDGRRAPMPPESLAGWLPDVARALDFIHAQGFVHRDVKPANILFDEHGHAYLGDFGIMKALAAPGSPGSDSALTTPGFLLGTPNYVAPEVVMGAAVDGRADQYALAMTVHEVLTGVNAMQGPTPSATVVNQMNLQPPPLTGLAPGVPEGLSSAVLRALSKNPSARFESCAAFAQAARRGPGGDDGGGSFIILGEDDAGADPSAATVVTACPSPGTGELAAAPGSTRARAGRPVVLAASAAALTLAAVCAAVALFLALRGRVGDAPGRDGTTPPAAAAAAPRPDETVSLNVVYGTEKQAWLEWAAAQFKERPEGRGIRVELVGKGSVEGAHMALGGSADRPVHVWSPASSAYSDVFEQSWKKAHGGRSPVARSENLALTPMVFVMWKSRHEAFVKRYGGLSFKTLAAAVREPRGWEEIGGRPEWGPFKLGHTHPGQSNSGLLTLVLMAYEFSGKHRGLTPSDVTAPAFRAWLADFEREVTRVGAVSHSSGTLMRDMVLRGPSQYDCVILYENLAVDYMARARDLWGDDLHVAYPEPNLWNEHPFYVLDAPWCGERERAAAGHFLDFLMSKEVQLRALEYGFRPGNPSVPVRVPGSPFLKNPESGLRLDVPRMAEPPKAEVVEALLQIYEQG